ncbi:hypothetical protein J8631_09855 [Serratia fonticola]|uniref:hypothetical protein n=1 Tax=Serratia fonticola TaxID=47917 RepID=UPI001AE637AE|nr:hypothetical protein [Serratia fonticola]MBP1035863.1 hypothetical protein [Serratia fonticola]
MSDYADEQFEKLSIDGECDVVARMRKLKLMQDWRLEVIEAARKFVNCKGRYHSEQNMTTLIELFRQEPEKP